ncbi:hypothetical protein M0805_004606 [Coniferiporia weirii]|nr:hypothetical protein M0805_004606 [Coniferiporia weirii]
MFALGRALPLIFLAGVASFALLSDYWKSFCEPDDDEEVGGRSGTGKKAGPSVSSRSTESSRQEYYCRYCFNYHLSANFLCQARLSQLQRVCNNTGSDPYHRVDAADTATIDDLRNRSHQVFPNIEQKDENHAPEPVEIELIRANKYRQMAGSEAGLRKTAFESSQRSFRSGDKAMAKQLSNEGKLHDGKVKRYNAQAAAAFFAYHNPGYSSSFTFLPKLKRCDLHGLYVEEALQYARDHLVRCRETGLEITTFIVGKGTHSQEGCAKIKPAIVQMLENMRGLRSTLHEINGGRIIVEFLEPY